MIPDVLYVGLWVVVRSSDRRVSARAQLARELKDEIERLWGEEGAVRAKVRERLLAK